MKYIYSILISLFLLGCSTDNIDYTLARMSGNKPAGFFYFKNSYDANHYMFEHKDFNISMIQTNQQDWIDMGGWHGAYIYDGIGLGLEIKEVRAYGDIFGYGINIFSSVGKTNEMTDAIKKGDIQYIRNNIKIDKEDKLRIEKHGKENYICEVMEYTKKNNKTNKFVSYSCYKFNPKHTKYKKVGITFIYTKSPTLPKELESLVKEYTYEDLLKRGQRVLDSLYIKDGWDE